MKKPSVEFLATAVERTSARAIACLAALAVAASGLAGCESTSANGSPGYSLSANNIIE